EFCLQFVRDSKFSSFNSNNNYPANSANSGNGIVISKKNKTQFMKATNLSLLVVLLGTMISINAQQKKLEYNIKRNGDVVGNIHFIQGVAGNRTVLNMESEVNTGFIFNCKAKAKEEVIYDNGIMVWSSIFRKLNGNVKVDKKTKANGSTYTVYKGSKKETLNNYPIH